MTRRPRFRRRYPAKPGRPTDRHTVEDRCGATGKVRYRHEAAALTALDTLIARNDPQHRERRAYRCPMCDGFHLTKESAA